MGKKKVVAKKNKLYIKSAEVRKIVNEQLGNKLDNTFQLYIADDKYYCPSVMDTKDVIKQSSVDRFEWTSERFDCDDFALVLKADFAKNAYKNGKRRAAHCFGIVWGMLPGPHAINWVINNDRKLRFVEPQNDRIFFPRKKDKDIWFMLV